MLKKNFIVGSLLLTIVRSGPEKVDHKAAKDRIKIWSVFHQIKRLILLPFDNTRHWV